MRIRVAASIPALFAAVVLTGPTRAQDDTSPTSRPAPPAEELLAAPAKGLDPRVDPSRITHTDPPPLPEQVILPMPSEHRIARDASEVPVDAARFAEATAAIERGLAFLRESQGVSGGWMMGAEAAPTDEPEKASPVAVAITALAAKAFAQSGADANGASPNDTAYRRGLLFVIRAQEEDGSFGGGALSNYVTAATVSALAASERDEFADEMARAVAWLQTGQWDQSEGLSARQDWYGGAGYGNHGRPDLSNTQMMLDALYDAGLSPSEPAFQRALVFLQRTQNVESNPSEWAGDDGGFIYTPANGGESKASEAAGEGVHGELIPEGQPRSLRSYGSMTYAGFKSMLYAGLSVDDPRVRAAFEWLRRHFTFEENPGLGQQGLYYYYHTLARALRVAQQETITDVQGRTHDWRAELIDAILKRQREDGSWVNDADRWMEGEPVLVTAYAVLALQEAIKPATAAD